MIYKCLYIVCPTDHLESAINKRFEGEKYFYTLLGNALVIDKTAVAQIASLIHSQDIKEVILVLSEDNAILLDAVNTQKFIEVKGLKGAYEYILKEKKHADKSWETFDENAMFFSYYLNRSIQDLEMGLKKLKVNQTKIKGKLYSKAYDGFRDIYPQLLYFNPIHLN